MISVLNNSDAGRDARPAASGLLPAAVAWSAAGGAVCVAWVGAIWVSQHVDADPALHTAALFGHLAALVAGFGAVLFVDVCGGAWLLGRLRLRDVLDVARIAHPIIWAGLAGLVVSGVLLSPDPTRPLTQVKLGLVLVAALNGLQASALHRRLTALGDVRPPRRLLVRTVLSAAASQLAWWTAMAVGFLNAQSS